MSSASCYKPHLRLQSWNVGVFNRIQIKFWRFEQSLAAHHEQWSNWHTLKATKKKKTMLKGCFHLYTANCKKQFTETATSGGFCKWVELKKKSQFWLLCRQKHTHTAESEQRCEVSAESDSNDSVWRLTPRETLLNGKERGRFEKYLLVKLGNNGATRTV